MPSINSLYPLFSVADPAAARDFLTGLFDLEVVFDAPWYVHLSQGGPAGFNVALIAEGHDSMPPGERDRGRSVLLTVEVDDATALDSRLRAERAEIVQPLRDDPTGQRHVMVRVPGGPVLDVVEWIAAPADPEAAQAST